MNITNPMNAATGLLGRHHYASSALAQVPNPTTADRHADTAPSQNAPLASTPENNGDTSDEDLLQTVTRLNEYAQSIRRTLNFSVDEDTGRAVVKVIDTATEEVVRQIPPENILNVLKHLAANANSDTRDPTGIFVQDKA